MGMACTPEPKYRRCYHFKPRRWFLYDDEKLVKVKSWIPSYFAGEIGWPVMLVDCGSRRFTIVPIWDWGRIIAPFVTYKEEKSNGMDFK